MGLKCTIINADCRNMSEISDSSIDLIVTSPPYWNLVDYGHSEQIGYTETLTDYYNSLLKVWSECWRVLKIGRYMVVNTGDVYVAASKEMPFHIIPLHASIIQQALSIGFLHMGCIIWHKYASSEISGGGRIPGSYPYPYNGRILYNHEYIMVFQKPGKPERKEEEIKEKSKILLEEWKVYFDSVWHVQNHKMKDHPASFPEEIPYRLIKMYSFWGDTVLDPFGGIGTTCKAAIKLNRNCIMYEINPEYVKKAMQSINSDMFTNVKIEVIERNVTFS